MNEEWQDKGEAKQWYIIHVGPGGYRLALKHAIEHMTVPNPPSLNGFFS